MKSKTLATLLELIPGGFFHVFGLGNIYAGNYTGFIIMISYFILQAINFLLCFVLIGYVTFPLTWLAYMIGSTLLARKACKWNI